MTAEEGRMRAVAAAEHSRPSSRNRSKTAPRRALGITVAIAALGLLLDQGTKAIATAQLEPGSRVALLGDLLGLTLVYNPGAAFSIGSGTTWVFTVLASIAAVVTIGFATRLRGVRWGVTLGLILGGAVGNLIDRLVNPPSVGNGHVTDFIAYGNLFVGNVADILVLAGVALLCLLLVTSDGQEQRKSTSADAALGSLPAPTEPRSSTRSNERED